MNPANLQKSYALAVDLLSVRGFIDIDIGTLLCFVRFGMLAILKFLATRTASKTVFDDSNNPSISSSECLAVSGKKKYIVGTNAALRQQYTRKYFQARLVNAIGVTSATRKLNSQDTAVDNPQVAARR